MSASNSAESNILKLIFNNTTWANIGDATGIVGSGAAGSLYVSLHTADPGEAGDQSTSETSYGSYARIGVARTSGAWGVSGTAPTTVSNNSAVTFATCTSGSATLTHFAIGRASSGTGEIIVSGALTASLAVSTGIQPNFSAGLLSTTCD